MFNIENLAFVSTLIFCVDAYSSYESHCPKNSIFKKCADPCQKVCGLTLPIDLCHKLPCTPGCECLEGFILSMKGHCIPIEDCRNEKCGKNAVHAETPCTSTCHDMFHGIPCEVDLVPGCECLDGYYMNLNGDCVESTECTVADVHCGGNETFSFCASSCPMSCSNMYLDVACNFMCNMRCDCKPGYVYNSEGMCVIPEDCAPADVACPIDGQEFTNCGYLQTCENMFDPLMPDACCERGCFCAGNKVFDTATKRCVEHHECKNSRKNKGCRRIDENMAFYPSHSACEATCDDPHPVCEKDDIDGCFCKEGYVLNCSNKCVPVETCCNCDF